MTSVSAISPDKTFDGGFVEKPTLRDELRSATTETHERLHRHGGLAAVQTGTIDRTAYTALLCRLYGFYRPFEATAQLAPERTRWLASDLAVFGVDDRIRLGLPRCAAFPADACPEYIMGARYVIEGSALGGRGLARQLDGLLGTGVIAGRRFFTGYGADTGVMWRGYLARLSAVHYTATGRATIIAGATATFALFEQWLDGWNDQNA